MLIKTPAEELNILAPLALDRLDVCLEYASLQQLLLPHTKTCTTKTLFSQAVIVQSSDLNNHFTDWANQQGDVLDAIHMLGLLYSDQNNTSNIRLGRA